MKSHQEKLRWLLHRPEFGANSYWQTVSALMKTVTACKKLLLMSVGDGETEVRRMRLIFSQLRQGPGSKPRSLVQLLSSSCKCSHWEQVSRLRKTSPKLSSSAFKG